MSRYLRKLTKNSTHLSSQVFEHSRKIDRSSSADTLGILAGLEEPGDPTDWKLEPRFAGPGHRLGGLWFASASLGRPAFLSTHFLKSAAKSEKFNEETLTLKRT